VELLPLGSLYEKVWKKLWEKRRQPRVMFDPGVLREKLGGFEMK